MRDQVTEAIDSLHFFQMGYFRTARVVMGMRSDFQDGCWRLNVYKISASACLTVIRKM